jgi:hypothetical protein
MSAPAHSEPIHAENQTPAAPVMPALPVDLAELAALWPTLPDAIKQGWLATARALAGM